MTTQEWKDLPTLQDVAAAQARGEEIQVSHGDKWLDFKVKSWYQSSSYRSRPVPKTRKVKMLAWYVRGSLIWYEEGSVTSVNWKRVPSEDKEIEVEDV